MELNEENVIAVLNKMNICKMLKDEDRGIKEKKHRSTDIKEVIEGPYKNAKIEVIPMIEIMKDEDSK